MPDKNQSYENIAKLNQNETIVNINPSNQLSSNVKTEDQQNLIRYYVCNVCEEQFGDLEDLYHHRQWMFHLFSRVNFISNELELLCGICAFITSDCDVYTEHVGTILF
uniref:CSON014092 protein n=1 Tax=Culicoides sonorensis TaxID=179676 RepID=A0A336MCF1_CULSO